MTTAKSTITISLSDANDETVAADCYQIEDGWVMLTTTGGNTVAAYPEARVTRIKNEGA